MNNSGNLFLLTLILIFSGIHGYGKKLGRKWVGMTPVELAPNSKPLGSTNAHFFNLLNKSAEQSDTSDRISNEAPKKVEEPQINFQVPKKRIKIPERTIPKNNVMIRNWVGSSPYQLSPHSIPLGSMVYKHGLNHDMQQKPLSSEGFEERESTFPLNLSVFGGTRAYYTDNVLRTKDAEIESGVWENSIGTSLETIPFGLGKYMTLIPRLDFLMQWANYGEKSVNDLWDYRFGMLKGGLNFYLPNDFLLTSGLEYSFLHSQFSGDKLFDSVSPSLSLQKIHAFSDNTFLMMDILLKYSKTNRVIDFVADNIFPDDGDNIQTTLNFNLIHTMGKDGQYILMPGLGVNRTEYLKNNQDGRVDLTYFGGLTFIWQIWEWFGLQAFSNYSIMRTNSLGKELLGESSSYRALDIGASVNVSHSF